MPKQTGGAAMKVKVNEVEHHVAADWHDETLLTVLREHLGLGGRNLAAVSVNAERAWCTSMAPP